MHFNNWKFVNYLDPRVNAYTAVQISRRCLLNPKYRIRFIRSISNGHDGYDMITELWRSVIRRRSCVYIYIYNIRVRLLHRLLHVHNNCRNSEINNLLCIYIRGALEYNIFQPSDGFVWKSVINVQIIISEEFRIAVNIVFGLFFMPRVNNVIYITLYAYNIFLDLFFFFWELSLGVKNIIRVWTMVFITSRVIIKYII